MIEEEALVPAEPNDKLLNIKEHLIAYFEGKGFKVSTSVYEKKSKENGNEKTLYVFVVELKFVYDEREKKFIYPIIEKRDVKNIMKRGSLLYLNLVDFRVMTGADEGKLGAMFFFEKASLPKKYQEILMRLLENMEKAKQQGGANG
jgi:hypothetical protein